MLIECHWRRATSRHLRRELSRLDLAGVEHDQPGVDAGDVGAIPSALMDRPCES